MIKWITKLILQLDIRKANLYLTTNNTRFLIFPWVRIPHLASHILGLISRRISSDWQVKYGHPVYLLETFVEKDRFKGTCYKAANWKFVGETTGRSRNDRYKNLRVPVKDIYLYPLDKNFREVLTKCSHLLKYSRKSPCVQIYFVNTSLPSIRK
ncbi:MAG: Druantia anti-phage system protein DruA [Carboxydocellales bacterium]